MIISRRQALRRSAFAFGSAMVAPQFANAETTAAPTSAIAADPTQRLVTEQFMIDAADPGIKLYIRKKRPADLQQFSSESMVGDRIGQRSCRFKAGAACATQPSGRIPGQPELLGRGQGILRAGEDQDPDSGGRRRVGSSDSQRGRTSVLP
jgi:hypothetical protein